MFGMINSIRDHLTVFSFAAAVPELDHGVLLYAQPKLEKYRNRKSRDCLREEPNR